MESIAYILYVAASYRIVLLVFSIFAIPISLILGAIVVAIGRTTAPQVGHGRSLLGRLFLLLLHSISALGLFSALAFLVFSIINLVVPHYIDGKLINDIGQKTDAKVLKVEATNNLLNEQRVMRHYVIYKTADGTNIETYFETWDFNIYPSANSVSYPGAGESFRVAYLPSNPTAFLILTEEKSDYSDGRKCNELLSEFEAAKRKIEFDPKDEKFTKAFNDAMKKLVEANCTKEAMPTGSMMLSPPTIPSPLPIQSPTESQLFVI